MTDPLTNALIFSLIPALVFLCWIVDRWAAKQTTAAVEVEAESEPLLPPVLPLLNVDLDIIVTDAAGRRWKVHFGVESAQMVEDE